MPKKGDRHRSPRTDARKCVRLLKAAMLSAPGEIVRVPNELAETLIADGKAEYASKKALKAQRAEKKAA